MASKKLKLPKHFSSLLAKPEDLLELIPLTSEFPHTYRLELHDSVITTMYHLIPFISGINKRVLQLRTTENGKISLGTYE